MAVLIATGLAVMLYPVLSNLYNQMTGSHAIQEFNEYISDQSEEILKEQRRLAEVYNASLKDSEVVCEQAYEEIMDFGNGMMGYIEIPVIEVYLPIYHGVDENVLSKGAGHISGSAFPIGGEGNHSVLSGHTGLPSAKLFTDLAEVEEGDLFYIHIAGEVAAYEVDQITVVLPEEVDKLLPEEGKDYCTLVTCTPYGINSHRLLVRGHRTQYTVPAQGDAESKTPGIYRWIWGIGIGLGILLAAACAGLLLKKKGIWLAAALVLTVTAGPKVYAEEACPAAEATTREVCAMQVDLHDSGFKELTGAEALPVEIALYRVADMDASGAYIPLRGWENLELENLYGEMDIQKWIVSAARAAAAVQNRSLSPDVLNRTQYGEVTLADLLPGLYLVLPGQVRSEKYIYDFAPFLISLPYYYEDAVGKLYQVTELIGEYALCLKGSVTDREPGPEATPEPETTPGPEETQVPSAQEGTSENPKPVKTDDRSSTVLGYLLSLVAVDLGLWKLAGDFSRGRCRKKSDGIYRRRVWNKTGVT